MSDEDRRIGDAFDRLTERRTSTTDVPAALVAVLERAPWWRRYRIPLAVGLAVPAVALFLFALLSADSTQRAVETDPGLAGTSSVPPAVETTVPASPTPTTPAPEVVAASAEEAIDLFLTNRGDTYAGDCAEPVGSGLCTSLAEPGDGGPERHQVFDQSSPTGETLVVATTGTEWFVVDTELDGYRVFYEPFQAGDSDSIDWITPDQTQTVFTAEPDLTRDRVDTVAVFSDALVGRHVPGDRCERSLIRIDSATGAVEQIGEGTEPLVSPTSRFLAYRAGDFEGREPGQGESCLVDGRLMVLDLYSGTESELAFANSGELGGISTVQWAPSAPLLAVDDGPDSTRSSIVRIEPSGVLTTVEIDRDVPELNGLISNEVVEWESNDVLVLRFYELAAETESLTARYAADGSFLSLVDLPADDPELPAVPPADDPEVPTVPPANDPEVPTFPPAAETLVHGGQTWAVVLAGVLGCCDDPVLDAAVSAASAAGYQTGPTDCDDGAAAALDLPEDETVATVSVYFDTEQAAIQAREAFAAADVEGVVAEVTTFCLD
ncbi:MAG: hypothetical protein ACR2QE_05520 [Acidimicrobiales bacterium]